MRVLALLSLLLAAVPARAAGDVAHSRALFVKGKAELDSGRYVEALTDLQAAYAAQSAPSLLYFIGEANDKAGRSKDAVHYYKRYVAEFPDGPMRKSAETRIAELQPGTRKRTLSLDALDLEQPAPRARPAKAKAKKGAKRPASEALTTAQPVLPAPEADLALPEPKASPPSPATAEAPAQALAAPSASAPAAAWSITPNQPSPKPESARPAAFAERPPAPVAEVPRAPVSPPAMQRLSVAKEEPAVNYVSYTARLLATGGAHMLAYATTASPGNGTLYTHGLAVGRQSGHFRNAAYLGFGTEFGGGTDTLQRYELSWQCIWSALGPDAPVSPYLGFRLGGMMVKSEVLTGGSLKPGFVGAALGGVELQLKHFVLSAGLGYDENLGPSLSRSDASLSGYSFDLGATARF